MMRQIKRDEGIKLADGRSAILSAVELPGGKFEVMLLTKDAAADEIRSAQCETEKVALLIFNEMRDQYHVPELTGRYKRLAEDLKEALAYGLEHAGTDDGGTCNFDSPNTVPAAVGSEESRNSSTCGRSRVLHMGLVLKEMLCVLRSWRWTGIHENQCGRGYEGFPRRPWVRRRDVLPDGLRWWHPMERGYSWSLEIRVTCETEAVEFTELPECTRESIMNLIRSGSTYGYFELDDGEEDNCKNGKYNCDSCMIEWRLHRARN